MIKGDIDLTVVIVTYNSQDTINGLISSITRERKSLSIEIIIIDNNSQDNTKNLLKKFGSDLIVRLNLENVGFPKAVNQGIVLSHGKYVLILNPDTRVIGNSLSKLVKFASTNKVGAVVPRLISTNGKAQPSVFHFPSIQNAIKAYFFNQEQYYGKYLPTNHTQPVEVAVMAAFLVPKVVIDKIGLLDERFFMYYEDIEYCRRLAKFKLPIIYLPQAKIEHVHGASAKFTSHFKSPLFRSAQIYHGVVYSKLLNLVLFLGQKWQKIIGK